MKTKIYSQGRCNNKKLQPFSDNVRLWKGTFTISYLRLEFDIIQDKYCDYTKIDPNSN